MISERNTQLEVLALNIYDETAQFYAKHSSRMGAAALGYKILYGPPRSGVRVVFFGSQPGGGSRDAQEGERAGERTQWPELFEYCVSTWELARRAREIWPLDLLEDSTALNANFFRSPNQNDWKIVPADVRREIEGFCLPRARQLLVAHKPQEIVVIGVGTFDQLRDRMIPVKTLEAQVLPNGRAERLIVEGKISGIPALGIKHLTGQWTKPNDLAKIRTFFRDRR